MDIFDDMRSKLNSNAVQQIDKFQQKYTERMKNTMYGIICHAYNQGMKDGKKVEEHHLKSAMKTDKEKLIMAWMIFRDSNPYGICDGREFRAIREPEYCMGQMIEDTIAILEDREEPDEWIEHHTHVEGYGKVYYQHNCRPELLENPYRFCPFCGKKMKSKYMP